jgi:hypothetical protein
MGSSLVCSRGIETLGKRDKETQMGGKNKKNDFIAYCGLYCGECPGHQGIIADLSRDLRKELRKVRMDKMAEALATASPFKEFKYYRETYDLLGTFVKFRCKRTCRQGGGPSFCKIRKCCQKKEIDDCWQCESKETLVFSGETLNMG